MRCPSCNEDNLPGEDVCQNCGMDLAGLDVAAWGLDPKDPVLVMTLAELPLKDSLVLSTTSTVTEAIKLMKQRHEGCVLVNDDQGVLKGIVTEHDVAARVAAPGRDPGRTLLETVMTPDPVTLQKGDSLAWALHRMAVDGYRHLPVFDDARLVGFLSIRTVLRVFCEA